MTIFEALHKPGGVLMYGIPEFRLPKGIVHAEVDYVKSLGVELRLDMVIGKTYTLDEIMTREGLRRHLSGDRGGPAHVHAHPRREL